MALRQLASTADALAWLAASGATALASDSRRVLPGAAFIAWPGLAVDGRRFVAAALASGAPACLVEAQGVQAFDFGGDTRVAALPGLKAATGAIASGFYGRPSEHLEVVACTGTNGKTSTAWWTAQALSQLGRRCGVVGTLGVGEPAGEVLHNGLTTPDPVTLQAAFRGFVDQGFQACAIEASSIGIVEDRMAGTRIAVAQFTNFTQDHLDYHGSMHAYWQAKEELFRWPGLRAAVLNVDDEHGAALVAPLCQHGLDVWTYSARADARLSARHIGYRAGGLAFDLHEGDAVVPVATAMIGDYNVSNLLAVVGALRALGLPLTDIASACSSLSPVPGRMQRVPGAADAPQVVVDYAHTPDALEKALLALQPFVRERGGALWCVFGCGGNRDTGKRPRMGMLAQRLAHRVVVTSDNPRLEAPGAIIDMILAGISGLDAVQVVEDRRAAIALAVREAGPKDVILIAGKGHEDYQDVGGVKHPFSDVAAAAAALAGRAHSRGVRS